MLKVRGDIILMLLMDLLPRDENAINGFISTCTDVTRKCYYISPLLNQHF